jgi:dTDP-4-amino-4,6-dideoxygalactose transaminase
VVRAGHLAQGPEVAALEAAVAALTGCRHAVAVSSGTTALYLALDALGVTRGDRVVVPSYACTALLHAVWAAGAQPVVADVNPATGNLDAEAVRRCLGPLVRAVIVPHLFGAAAPVATIAAMGIPVVEDCAMALGATCGGRPLGSLGTLAVCSFYATKLVAAGEGGMVLTQDAGLAAAVRGQRSYDGLPADRPRLNAKLTDLAAAVARVQVDRLPEFIARRQRLAARYTAALAGLGLALPAADPERVWYRFVVQAQGDAAGLLRAVNQRGVAARRPVSSPLHLELGLTDAAFPGASLAWRQSMSLPLYPTLTDAEFDRVVEAVKLAC